MQGYFVWLRTEYQSRQVTGRSRSLAPKTIRNFHITLSAFFTWASRELEIASPLKAIPVPKYEEPPVEPFTKEQIEALLKARESCKEAQPIDRRKFTMRRATGKRAQALISKVVASRFSFCAGQGSACFTDQLIGPRKIWIVFDKRA